MPMAMTNDTMIIIILEKCSDSYHSSSDLTCFFKFVDFV